MNVIFSAGTTPQLHNCTVTSHVRLITVECSFPGRFQVTVLSSAIDRVSVLHVNTSMDPQTPVTVQVPENGEYLVTVLPFLDGMGILSGMKLFQIHMVDDTPTTQGNFMLFVGYVLDYAFRPFHFNSFDITSIAACGYGGSGAGSGADDSGAGAGADNGVLEMQTAQEG